MCLYPKLMKNRKYIKNKKNKGIVPEATDKRVLMVPVGCGKCMECRKQKSSIWRTRLMEEIRERKDGVFVTLTFSDESLIELGEGIETLDGYELDNEIATKGVRRFLERWRKKYGKSVRHWLVTELGQTKTERIHLHGILWTENEKKLEIDNIWKYGNVWLGNYVNEKTVNYIVKYISKTDEKHKEYRSKMLVSPGIGSSYLKRKDAERNKFNGKDTKETYSLRSGAKVSLPIYYRNKLYSEDEREKLWLKKLDEEVRWVNGKKIDISKGDDLYYKVLENERAKNKRLGYGDDEVDWEKKRYENNRRRLLKMQRIKKQG